MFTKRQTNILEILLKNTSGITGSMIGEKLSVSSRTIRNDISQINSLLSNNDISISSSNKSGYFLKVEYIGKLKEILNNEKGVNSDYYLDDHRDFVILGKVLFEGKQNIYDLSEVLFVSTRTIYKEVKNLQDELVKKYYFYGLKFEKESVFIKSSEEEIRKLIFRIVSEHVLRKSITLKDIKILFNDNFNLKKLNNITNKIKDYFIINEIFIDEDYIRLIIWILYIVEVRNSNNFFIRKSKLKELNEGILALIDALVDEDIKLQENDIAFIHDFLWIIKLENKDTISNSTIKVVDEFIRQINDRYNIELEDNNVILENITVHIEYMLRRVKNDYQLVNTIREDIKYRYPFSYEISMLIVNIVYDAIGKYPIDDEVANIAVWIEQLVTYFNKKVKVLVIPNSRLGINDLIVRWIKNNFYNSIEIIDSIPAYALKDYKRLNEVEIIISNNKITDVPSIPVYIINKIPDIKDLDKVNDIVHNIKIGRKFKNVIKKFFDLNLVSIYKEEISLKQAILNGVNELKINNISDINMYIEDVLMREKKYPTIIGESLMIPRPINTFSNKTLVSPIILKKPISYNGKNIRIIFLLTIEDKLDYDLSTLFELFKRVALNKDILKSLIDIDNEDEFLETLSNLSKNINY